MSTVGVFAGMTPAEIALAVIEHGSLAAAEKHLEQKNALAGQGEGGNRTNGEGTIMDKVTLSEHERHLFDEWLVSAREKWAALAARSIEDLPAAMVAEWRGLGSRDERILKEAARAEFLDGLAWPLPAPDWAVRGELDVELTGVTVAASFTGREHGSGAVSAWVETWFYVNVVDDDAHVDEVPQIMAGTLTGGTPRVVFSGPEELSPVDALSLAAVLRAASREARR